MELVLKGNFQVEEFGEECQEPGCPINYLLSLDGKYWVAYSATKKEWTKGQLVPMTLKLDCEEAKALDKAPAALETSFPFGVPRSIYLCNLKQELP